MGSNPTTQTIAQKGEKISSLMRNLRYEEVKLIRVVFGPAPKYGPDMMLWSNGS